MNETQAPEDGERTLVANAAALRGAAGAVVPRDHYLSIVAGALAGRMVRLGPAPLTLGRTSAAQLVLPDSEVSGRHCQVSLAATGSALQVRDLGSTNGTFVDDVRIADAALLQPGGLLRLGSQVLRHDWLQRGEAEKLEQQQKDIEKARHYVESLLPAPLEQGRIRAEWAYVPSTHLGGDAFGYHQLDEDHFCAYLMDVSGHGVGAAMHSVSVMNVMRQRALPGCDFHEPGDVLARLNDMFQMDAHDGMYFTMWYGVYDLRSGGLRFACAGHHASYVVSADRLRVTPLRTRNLVIGAVPARSFASAQAPIEPGSTLYVFSDGVYEVLARDGRQLGLNDFLPLLQQPRADAGGEARRIEARVRAQARPGSFDDDFTLLAVTFVSSC